MTARVILTMALCTLTWNANSETDLLGYRVYHRVDGELYGAWSLQLGLSTQTTCTELGIQDDGLLHYFTVTAFNAYGESLPASEVSWLAPAPPPPDPTPEPICRRWLKNGRCWKWM